MTTTVFAVLGPELGRNRAVAEMLVRRVRVVVIGRTIGGQNGNPTASLFLHFLMRDVASRVILLRP